MIAHRIAEPRDRTFIVSAWSSSFRRSYYAGIISMADWAEVMHAQIEQLLDRDSTVAIVAYDTNDDDFLYGFVAGDMSERKLPVLHYVYVKQPHRKDGIARGLIAAMGVDPTKPLIYTCRTEVTRWLLPKIPGAKWNPLAARFPKPSP